MAISISNRDLFEVFKQNSGKTRPDRIKKIEEFIFQKLLIKDHETTFKKALSRWLSIFITKLSSKWTTCCRITERFESQNSDWLARRATLPIPDDMTSFGSRGRPSKLFSDCTERSKRIKVTNLTKSTSASELAFAAKMSIRAEGNDAAAKVIQEAALTTPTRGSRMRATWKQSQSATGIIPYSPEEALSMLIELNLSKEQYMKLRKHAKNRNADIYPSYVRVLEAKQKCYPEEVSVRESSAEVKLQALLDHTAQRIMQLQEPVLATIYEADATELELLSKWGCDGSSGQSVYKQSYSEANVSDSSIFLTAIVPLQLNFIHNQTQEKKIIWQNPRPCSPRYCRPIRVQMLKETTKVTVNEKKYIDNQIKNLTHTTYTTSLGSEFRVLHKLMFTMVDGKVCSAVTGVSPQRCCICGAYPKDMNNIEKVMLREVDVTAYDFGLSTLHAHIRFMECLLHVAYRLEIKSWQVSTDFQKESVSSRKTDIQNEFRKKMGLLIDVTKQGAGSTNGGNTAHRFFHNPSLSAAITGLDQALISRFSVILITLSCGFKINVKRFVKYCIDTAHLFIKLYGWFKMPSSVHKILIHGSEVVSAALLPIGQLSEEVQEARNKDVRKYREKHTRKCSRTDTTRDLFNRLLLSSDPIISSAKRLPPKSKHCLPAEVRHLLVASENHTTLATTEPSD